MYPLRRFALELWRAKAMGPLVPDQTHVTPLRIMPWDIDPFLDLNNGRTLTLYDIGRFAIAARTGLAQVMRKKGWRMTVMGSSIRYRHRITMGQKIHLRTRLAWAEGRFVYVEQGMFRPDGTCCNHALLRMGVIGDSGLISASDFADALGLHFPEGGAPAWIAAWAQAEDHRPWPPAL